MATLTETYRTVERHLTGDSRRIVTDDGRLNSMPDGAYEIKNDVRKISSVVLREEYIDKLPEPTTKHVEVAPYVDEVVKYVIKKEVREVERIVPKYVEQFVDKYVDVPKYVEEVKVVDQIVPVEVIKKVPKYIQENTPKAVHQDVEVSHKHAKLLSKKVDNEVIQVPKTVEVVKHIPVTKYDKKSQKLIVAQTVKPVIIEGQGELEVDVTTYEPEVVTVDIHVAKFVDTKLIKVGEAKTEHRVVAVPPSQYNSMLQYLNQHLSEEERQQLPYIQDNYGKVTFMQDPLAWKSPMDGVQIHPLPRGQALWSSGTEVKSSMTGGDMSHHEVQKYEREAESAYENRIREFSMKKHEIEMKMADYNRREAERAQQALHRLNAEFDHQYHLQLEEFRRKNIENEERARLGVSDQSHSFHQSHSHIAY